MPDFFPKEAAERYDERNSKLSRISDCLHFLTSLALQGLPSNAHVLCAGVGTGAELLFLARTFPGWTFVALDPSSPMLDVCRDRCEQAGILARCEFVHGHVDDLPEQANFDAALSILVAHFIPRDERPAFLQAMTRRLRTGGYLVTAEISFDLDSAAWPPMLDGWKAVQGMMGATPESLAALPQLLRNKLTVLPPAETEELLRASGVAVPVRFFQAFMICGWYGQKV
ncbi:MAG: class I SAM-dependent methyltransferase [Pseudomonadota bacterium]|nr:class I SAM-dependent methyltransferase [Pseudomonadota bacterium]